MCGIVAVVREPGQRDLPDLAALLGALDAVEATLAAAAPDVETLDAAATSLRAIDRALRVDDGIAALVGDPVRAGALEHRARACARMVVDLDARLDATVLDGDTIEAFNAALVA